MKTDGGPAFPACHCGLKAETKQGHQYLCGKHYRIGQMRATKSGPAKTGAIITPTNALGAPGVASPPFDLRDWLAGQALPALLLAAELAYSFGKRDSPPKIRDAASDAYRTADAVLAERAKDA